MPKKFYAVVAGHTPGIYTDWPTTQSMVKGYKGAIYKSFMSREEAESFIQSSTANTETDLTNKIIIYTDGSFSHDACGFGVVIIYPDGRIVKSYGRVPLPPTNNVAELYAIYVALSLIKEDVVIYSDSMYSISCFTTYIHSWIQKGWNGVANRNIIEPTFLLCKGRSVIFKHVDAHAGMEFNEEADRLANMGRLSDNNLLFL